MRRKRKPRSQNWHTLVTNRHTLVRLGRIRSQAGGGWPSPHPGWGVRRRRAREEREAKARAPPRVKLNAWHAGAAARLEIMERLPRRHLVGIACTALAILVLALAAACGGDDGGPDGDGPLPGEGTPPVTIGTKDFPEQFILGELYAQALEAQGYTVNLNKNIGPTETVDEALTSGEIDAYPEYLGVAVSVVASEQEPTTSAEETYERARDFYAERGQTISSATPFFNVDAIGTTTELAEANGLRTVADLRKLESFTLGARPEFETRFQGLRGLEEVYGLTNAEFVTLPQGITYEALDDGTVDTINVFSTDAQLASERYVVLEDPEGLFGYQHVALVIDSAKLEELGADTFMAVVDQVNALLTNEAVIEMNQAVFLEEQPEAEVAGRSSRTTAFSPSRRAPKRVRRRLRPDREPQLLQIRRDWIAAAREGDPFAYERPRAARALSQPCALPQVDRLRGDDELDRGNPLAELDLLREPSRRERRHRHAILDALRVRCARHLEGNRLRQEPRLGDERLAGDSELGQRVLGEPTLDRKPVGQA